MADFRPNYSLTEYPFNADPLDPLAGSTDADMLVPVSGVASLSDLEDKIAKLTAPNAQQPLFVLVKGGDNCGLTTTANHLRSRFAHHGNIKAVDLIAVKGYANDSDAAAFWLNWLSELYEQIDIGHLPVSKELADRFQSALNDASGTQLHIRFRPLLRRLAAELSSGTPRKIFCVCVENPRNPAFLETAFLLFSSCPTICVFVVGEYADGRERVIAHFDEYSGPGDTATVRMTPLSASETEQVVRKRWKIANDSVPNPFEAGSIEHAFADRPRPVKRVMVLMNQVLGHKATVEFPSKRWPSDVELRFTGGDLKGRISFIEDEVLGTRRK